MAKHRAAVAEEKEKAGVALALALIAGFVDAVGFLAIIHVFTAHQSGNSAAMGAYFGSGKFLKGLGRLLPIPCYVFGLFFGSFLTEITAILHWKHSASAAFALEILLLGGFYFAGNHPGKGGETSRILHHVLIVALPSIAMGLQSTTIRRVGSESVRTTFVTGMLTNLAENSVAYLFWLGSVIRKHGPGKLGVALRLSPRQHCFVRATLGGMIWLGFATGAFLGGWTMRRWMLKCLIIPICGLFGVIISDWIDPIPLANAPLARKAAEGGV